MSLSKTQIISNANVLGGGNTVPNLRQTFNNTQNWTVPTGVNGIVFVIAGGGGSGGTSSSGTNYGGGGGSAGAVGVKAVGVTPGTTVSVTIGAGGTAVNTTVSSGVNGGSSTIDIGNIRYTAGGGRGGNPGNNNNGANIVSPLNFTIENKTAGTLGSAPEPLTNFVLEMPMDSLLCSTRTGNTLSDQSISFYKGSILTNVLSVPNTVSGNNVGNMNPFTGPNTNLLLGGPITGNIPNSSTTRFAGQGGQSGNYSNNEFGAQSGAGGATLAPRDGAPGLAGGGGGANGLVGGPAGAGGGGAGGFGGAESNTATRGGGGGGGLTGAGGTNNTGAGGNGGTGGGGGGGAASTTAASGAGGAGAVLIYYQEKINDS